MNRTNLLYRRQSWTINKHFIFPNRFSQTALHIKRTISENNMLVLPFHWRPTDDDTALNEYDWIKAYRSTEGKYTFL